MSLKTIYKYCNYKKIICHPEILSQRKNEEKFRQVYDINKTVFKQPRSAVISKFIAKNTCLS